MEWNLEEALDYYKRQGIDPEPIVGCSGECSDCHHDHGHGEEEEE